MKGGLYIIRQNGEVETREITKEPTGDELHEIVGGYIEVVPYWNILIIPSKGIMSNCVVFCDSDGKTTGGKLFNEHATILWESVLNRKGMSAAGKDHLVGDIVAVWGDEELLAML